MENDSRLLPLIDLLPDMTYWKDHAVYRGLQARIKQNSGNESHYLTVTPMLLDVGDNWQHAPDQIEIQHSSTTEIKHSVRFRRAKCMPFDSRVIAALDVTGSLTLYRLKQLRYMSESSPEYTSTSVTLRCRIQANADFCWNPHSRSRLAISSDDGYIFINDFGRNTEMYYSPSHRPSETSWYSENIFGSAGCEGKFKIWDVRIGGCLSTQVAHDGCITTINSSPFGAHQFITGGADCKIALWDIRDMLRPLYTRHIGRFPVTRVSWSPHKINLFGVLGSDGEACLAAVHNGNVNRIRNYNTPFYSVYDMAWHPSRNVIYCVDRRGRIFSL